RRRRRSRARSRRGGGAAPAGGLLGRTLTLLGCLLEPGLDERVVQELLRVEERQPARTRAEHDHDELLLTPPHRDGQVVARLAREAGLERLDADRVVEERDVPHVDAAVEDEGLAP